MFKYSDDNKRYHTLSYYNRHHGGKTFKAALDGGFTCPNIDGTKGVGGCTYCSDGSGYFTKGALDISSQIDAEVRRIRQKTPSARIVGYLQANSCTYAVPSRLRQIYSEILSHPDISGLTVGTRADCISIEIADLLQELNISVELGLQTVHEKTAALINRCHSFDEFIKGYNLLKERGVRVCVHLINGLPGEDKQMMVESARVLGALNPDGVKIHLLHVIKGTPMECLYLEGGLTPLTREQYVDTVIAQLEVLPPETVIERLTGDADKKTLVAPLWSADKIATLAMIDRKMAEYNTRQGRLIEK